MCPVVGRHHPLSATLVGIFFGFLVLYSTVHADELVTLQAGKDSFLKVSTLGNQLVIEIDGTKLHFPLDDETTPNSSTPPSLRQANQFLLKSFESQLLHGSGQKEVGLLAEAYRLAPSDARIAYWYSRSLVNVGSGKAAQKAFASHRDAIAATYPGLIDRLAEQIDRRVQLELLPSKLVQQIDKIDLTAGGAAAFFDDKEPHAAFFRLVDQHGKPIEASAFGISCNGQNKRTQSFARGYYLFTYLLHRGSSPSPCQLKISQYGLQNKTFEFAGEANGVADAGDFQIKRMGEVDRRPAVVHVVDAQGKPLAGVTVTFTPAANRRNGEKIPTSKSDKKGRVEMRLFPYTYTCYANLKDHNRDSQSLEVSSDASGANALELTLHRLIAATVKVHWRAKILGNPNPNPNLSPGEPVSIGGIELHNGVQSHPYSSVPWVRLQQKDDQLQLLLTEQPQYGPLGITGNSWIGRIETANGSAVDFESIDRVRSANPSSAFGRNPFSGKSASEVDGLLRSRGFRAVGPDPSAGRGAYFHPTTERKYYLDSGGTYRAGKELPHVDVHRLQDGVNLEGVKKKFPLGGSLYE